MSAPGIRRSMMTIMLIASTLLSVVWHAADVRASGVTVYLQPINVTTGAPIFDACFVFLGASEEGCDENGDGYIRYQDMQPGTYTVRQTRDASGYVTMPDTTVTVQSSGDQTITLTLQPRSSSGGGKVDIAIVPTDARSGNALPGACFRIGSYSEEGCDENLDGQVTFSAIPVGDWEVIQTRAPAGYSVAPSQWMTIDHAGHYYFLQPSSGSNPGLVHVALVTRDPGNGSLVTGTCYIIQNASIEGCDENGDGQVDFADVTPGTYTVQQTRTPAGYPAVRPFEIQITNDPTQAFIVKQAARQHDANHRNLSVVITDQVTGARIMGTNACVRVVGASEVGCDENGDGQIDFLDIPVGTQQVEFVQAPPGYGPETSRYTILVEAGPFPNVTVYLGMVRT